MKKNEYQLLKERHQKEFNNLPLAFAFSKEQFKEGMNKLGLEETETNQVVAISGGGFIKKTDVPKLEKVLSSQKKEIADKIANDKTGDGFIKDMFVYELDNHEYSLTRNPEDTLIALGISEYDFRRNPSLLKGFELAKNEIIDRDNEIDLEEEMDK